MSHASFVHLRVHSAYSLAEGAIKIHELAKLCVQNQMPAVALTDTGNLFGALEFSLACAEKGIQPIIGCQIALGREDNARGTNGSLLEPDQLVLLVQNETGYRNLLHLVSQAFLGTPGDEIPQVSLKKIAEHASGLLALTGGPKGLVGRLLLEDKHDKAADSLKRLADIFPDRLYVEVMRHGVFDEDRIEKDLVDLAYSEDLPLLATNEACFAEVGMYQAHDALICIAEKSFISVADRRRMTPDHRFKSAEEMTTLFSDLPEAVNNTLVVARRCAFTVDRRDPILPRSPKTGSNTEEVALEIAAKEGLEERLRNKVYDPAMSDSEKAQAATPYQERLIYELQIIKDMGFAGYFIIVADFIQWAKQEGIPVGPGRGSGAGSVVAWALTITDLDPLSFNLLFERFLNPERVSMPDFDIDFCQERREEVIRYVQAEYGSDRVAQIITFGKLQARAVLRNVGRVLEIPLGYVDKICKMVPINPANPVTLSEAINSEPELQTLRETDEHVAQMLDISLKLEGLYSHASTHAAGVVIGDRPLDELVPLYRDPHSEMPVTQFNMKWVEQAGLVKFDFLGLKTLTVLERAIGLLQLRGREIKLLDIPLDDPKTFQLLSSGETSGVFQLESSGMRDVLQKLKPDHFEDIIAVVALYRPGPMDNIESFIDRKHGRERITYMHELLEPILEETYGIMIYQEQVMQAAQEIAGYSLGNADLLRRAMGKKIKAEMNAQRKTFIDGSTSRGTSTEQASEVFETMAKFAGYGFNKSHATGYALVAYQTAYLKANHPVEFMAATMSLDMQNTDKLSAFRSELTRLGIDLLPPSVNSSSVDFQVDDGAVSYALAAIKHVGEGAMRSLVKERDANGPFRDVTDFARRLDTRVINKRLIESLIKAGGLDCLCDNRAKMMAAAEVLMQEAHAAAEARTSNQSNLFGDEQDSRPVTMNNVVDWEPMERLTNELDAIGFYLTAHPVDTFSNDLAELNVKRARDILTLSIEDCMVPVRMVGTMVAKRERVGRRGNRYAFVTLSDDTGTYEAVFFSDVISASREMLESGKPLLVTLDARIEDDKVRLMATKVEALEEAVTGRLRNIEIHVSDQLSIDKLTTVLADDGYGQGKIVFVVRANGHLVEIKLNDGYAVSPATVSAIRNMAGVTELKVL